MSDQNQQPTQSSREQSTPAQIKSQNFFSSFFGKVITIFVLIIAAFFAFFNLVGLSFGCGLGLGHKFDCRVLLPFDWNLFLLEIVLLILFFIFLFLDKKNFVKYLLILNIIVFCLIFAPIRVYYSHLLSSDFKEKYLEGFSATACDQGLPSVPWGQHFSSSECYYELGLCDKIGEPDSRHSCFFDVEGHLKPGKIHSAEECNIVGNYSDIISCERSFGIKTDTLENLKYCEGLVGRNEEHAIGHRHACFDDVFASGVGLGGMQSYAISNKENPEACVKFEGTKKDVCLFWMMQYSPTNRLTFCDQMTTSEIYKDDCKVLYQKYLEPIELEKAEKKLESEKAALRAQGIFPTVDWLTYTNKNLHISFLYPKEWKVGDGYVDPGLVGVVYPQGTGKDIGINHVIGINVTVLKSVGVTQLKGYFDQYVKESLGLVYHVDTTGQTQVDGILGYNYEASAINPKGRSRGVMVSYNGNGYLISMSIELDNFSLYEAFLKNFKFTK